MNLNEEIDITRATGVIQKLIGYIGAIALLIGGITMYVDLPIIGRVTCLYCPTPSGYLYIVLAIVAGFLIYAEKIKFLYLTGGLAFLLLAYDAYSATTIGYAVQMLLSGGLAPSMGGQMDPVMSQMMQNTELSIPIAWILIGLGALLMVMSPQIEAKKDEKTSINPREAHLQERIQELDKIVKMYKEGDISKQEFSHLKEEILGTTKEK
ncbi:hypothetical protein Mhun_1159 [Methanospirillum hungatei JF-1]|jgi:hypothetical protein|uniref:Uncharacterized protein n=1 Tax=Methanospirillum hungatei JF-1 (strain ATCC 27890 / DSM 864 / NBRC 100397 / JF-1) TaxID=323259 RepID=Q2FPB9_METHJ|nr:hypothetical protein [Methanospirillum hungatei]ABD40907.1 hypothetical protein Mhun_1159 [Methanospirillum hungatei JF-1]